MVYIQRFVTRTLWLLGVVRLFSWLFRVDDAVTAWASTHIPQSLALIVLFMILVMIIWDSDRNRLEDDYLSRLPPDLARKLPEPVRQDDERGD